MYKIIGADQKEYGPISSDQLRQWITEGRVNGETKVLPDGATVWKRVAELPEFAPTLPATPASVPAPPLPGPTLAPGSPMPMSMTPPPPRSNQLAVWSMVTGILGLVCCQFLAPIGIVLGVVALNQIKKNPHETGRGFAITAIVLGIISLIILVIAIAVGIASPGLFTNFPNLLNQ